MSTSVYGQINISISQQLIAIDPECEPSSKYIDHIGWDVIEDLDETDLKDQYHIPDFVQRCRIYAAV